MSRNSVGLTLTQTSDSLDTFKKLDILIAQILKWLFTVDDTEKLARIFKVLSVDARVRIIQLLKSRPFCVNALARQLGITAAAVSQHLRVLRDAELVTSDRQGYYVHYQINKSTLARRRESADLFLGGMD